MAVVVNLIWGHREAIYFRMKGWTGFRSGGVICPSGSHTTHHTREILRGLQGGLAKRNPPRCSTRTRQAMT
jgi:hypothetical protein